MSIAEVMFFVLYVIVWTYLWYIIGRNDVYFDTVEKKFKKVRNKK